jgi:hypothetical protein
MLRKAATPEVIASGLLARFLLAMPPRRPKRWSAADVAPEVRERFCRLLHGLRMLNFRIADLEVWPVEVDLTADARHAWAAWVDSHGVTTASLGGAEAALSAKIEGAAGRLALLHWACRYVEGTAGERIDAPAIEAGVGLARWFLAEGLRIYQVLGIGGGQASHGVPELVRWLAEHHPHGASVRDLYTFGPRRYRNNPDEAEEALAELVAAGYGEWVIVPPASGGGPAKRVFRLADEWLWMHNPDISAKNEGSAANSHAATTEPQPAEGAEIEEWEIWSDERS